MEIALLLELGYIENALGGYVHTDGNYRITVDVAQAWITKTRVFNGANVYQTNYSTLPSFIRALGTTMDKD